MAVRPPARGSILAILAVALVVRLSSAVFADAEVFARIREEAASRSEIMRTLHMLTDVYGPRVTGSPNAKAAAEWAVKAMTAWGFENGHLEPWDFGHPGWTNDLVTAHIVAPVRDQLTVEVLAWTPGTNGTVRAPVVVLTLPADPTALELNAYFSTVRASVKGAIVLAGRPRVVPVTLEPRATRQDEGRLRARYDPAAAPAGARAPAASAQTRTGLTAAEINRRLDDFLRANGTLVRVNDAGRELGQIAAFHNARFDVSVVVPTVVMRNEDYGRIVRIAADGTPVTLEIVIRNQLHPDGRTAYNAVAEIPGTDKRNEIVMLGGHLDSWQSATGATDNAVGCAVMMEAARLLQAIGIKPRRTIRVALWSGEEQGLLGSQAYVREHFGSAERPKSGHALLSAYLNLDTGTGRIRGATVFGPPAAGETLRGMLAPFADLGVVGAGTTTRRTLGGTDSTTFSAAGLPGIGFDQDPIQYDSATHHTNLDTYERVVEADVRSASIVVAGVLYQLAMRDELVPRFDRSSMPAGNWR